MRYEMAKSNYRNPTLNNQTQESIIAHTLRYRAHFGTV